MRTSKLDDRRHFFARCLGAGALGLSYGLGGCVSSHPVPSSPTAKADPKAEAGETQSIAFESLHGFCDGLRAHRRR